MIRKLFILSLCLITFSCKGQPKQSDKSDFDETKYEFNTPDDLVKSYVRNLKNCIPDSILKHCLSKEATLYFVRQTAKLRPDAQNIEQAIQAIDTQYEESQNQYVIATKNIKWNIDKEGIDISKAEIESIDYKIEDWYGLKPQIMFAAVTVKIKYNNKIYTLKLPQLGRLKNKWFILGPEFWWEDNMMPWDMLYKK